MDIFEQPPADHARTPASTKALEIRRQGFSWPAILFAAELEYTGSPNG